MMMLTMKIMTISIWWKAPVQELSKEELHLLRNTQLLPLLSLDREAYDGHEYDGREHDDLGYD